MRSGHTWAARKQSLQESSEGSIQEPEAFTDNVELELCVPSLSYFYEIDMKAHLLSLILMLFFGGFGYVNAPQPEFTFTIRTEKRVFKPGERISVLAVLRNQSGKSIYVPHAMSPCSGLESQVRFSLFVIQGKLNASGVGCGIGSGCGDCQPPSSFEEHVRTTWILLKPGELFGARIEGFLSAPDTPGIYKIEAEYLPEELATGDRAGPLGDQIRVIAQPYNAAPVEILVRR
jgi:hypothetical protein